MNHKQSTMHRQQNGDSF